MRQHSGHTRYRFRRSCIEWPLWAFWVSAVAASAACLSLLPTPLGSLFFQLGLGPFCPSYWSDLGFLLPNQIHTVIFKFLHLHMSKIRLCGKLTRPFCNLDLYHNQVVKQYRDSVLTYHSIRCMTSFTIHYI